MSNQIVNLDKVGKHKLMLVLRQDSNVFFSFFSDPFADAAKGGENDVQDGLVHIRIQQRNGRKTLTTIQGLSSEYDLKKILRACKKVCQHGEIIFKKKCSWLIFLFALYSRSLLAMGL